MSCEESAKDKERNLTIGCLFMIVFGTLASIGMYTVIGWIVG